MVQRKCFSERHEWYLKDVVCMDNSDKTRHLKGIIIKRWAKQKEKSTIWRLPFAMFYDCMQINCELVTAQHD